MRLLTYILVMATAIAVGSCSRKKSADKRSESQPSQEEISQTPDEPSSSPVVVPQVAVPKQEKITKTPLSGHHIVRLQAEQVSSILRNRLGLTKYVSFDSEFNRERDSLIDQFGVALGGVDFLTTESRDFLTRGHTILVAKVIAWRAARDIVEYDLNNPGSTALFNTCDVSSTESSQSCFKDQIEDIFWRIFSRPPSSEEHAKLKSFFSAVKTQESGSSSKAWMAVLYALMATMEFWHI